MGSRKSDRGCGWNLVAKKKRKKKRERCKSRCIKVARAAPSLSSGHGGAAPGIQATRILTRRGKSLARELVTFENDDEENRSQGEVVRERPRASSML